MSTRFSRSYDRRRADLQGERVHYSLEHRDVERLTEFGAEPEVARLVGRGSRRETLARQAEVATMPPRSRSSTKAMSSGWLSFSDPAREKFKHAGVDLFLTSSRHGRASAATSVRRSPVG